MALWKFFLYVFINILIVYLAIGLFGGCTTRPRELVSDIIPGAAAVRTDLDELGAGQAELALTGQRIESGLSELERSLEARTGADAEFADIIQRVRGRPVDPGFIKEWRNSRIEGRIGSREAENPEGPDP